MEGCYWSIEQLFKYECRNLGKPVNSKVNDFAPAILSNDSNIFVVSERSRINSKGENTDGDNSTNPFYFTLAGENWNENKGFPLIKKIESGTNEGAGVFTRDKSKYYFTACGRENDGYCKIYYSEKDGEKWSKPKKLNSSINSEGSDNKHPAISDSGDTLYFVSTRAGGYGSGDIWISTKSEGEKWSEPENLGSDINTPFNEVTPFWYEPEDALFFSSDGHKGFGGLDIFVAKLDENKLYKVTNFSDPFNTNLDDIYFTLGDDKGYLVSNRFGGLGGFDIYSFDNMFKQRGYKNYKKKLAKISEEISTLEYDVDIIQPEIPTELIEFDIQAIYDRIMSAKMAALIHNVRLVYFEPDYTDYQKLTIDDKSIIDMLYMAYEVDLGQDVIDSIKFADEEAYLALDVDTKSFVDRMAESYGNVSGGADYVKISNDDSNYYSNLKVVQKEDIDRIISFRIKKIETENNNTAEIYDSELSANELLNIDGDVNPLDDRTYESIISTQMAGFIHNYNYQFIKPDYKVYSALDIADMSILDMDFKSRAFELDDVLLDSIRKADEAEYYSLSQDDKKRVDNMADACLAMDQDSAYVDFSTINEQFMFNLEIGQKRRFDRLVAFSCVKSEFIAVTETTTDIQEIFPNIDTALVTPKLQAEYKRIVSNLTAGFIYNVRYPFAEPDQFIYEEFSEDDKGLVEMLFIMQSKKYSTNVINSIKAEDKAEYAKLVGTKKTSIDAIAKKISISPYDSSYIELKEPLFNFYEELTLEEKQVADRLIAFQVYNINNAKKDAAIKYVDILTDEIGVTSEDEAGVLFSKKELDDIERVLSFRVACHVHNINLPFIESDFIISENLTIENLSILDMMYDTKVYGMQDPVVIKAIQKADASEYKKLNKADKGFIDIVAETFVFNDTSEFISLSNFDTEKYKNYSIQEKYKMDRLLVYKLKKLYSPDPTVASTEEFLNRDILYVKEMSNDNDLISKELYSNYEKILSVKVAAAIHDVAMPFIKSDFTIYSDFTDDDKSIVEMMVDTKKVGLQNKLLADSLRTKDSKRYEKLTIDDKAFVDRIVVEYLDLDNSGISVNINGDDTERYNQLNTKVKFKYDRLVAHRLKFFQQATKVEEALVEVIMEDELSIEEVIDTDLISEEQNSAYDRLIAFNLASYIYNEKIPYPQTDYELAKTLSDDDLSIMDMMYLAKTFNFRTNSATDSIKNADKVLFSMLTEEDKEFVNNLLRAYMMASDSAEFVELNKADSKRYAKLSIEEKFKIDRLFISKLSVQIENNGIVAEAEEKLQNDDLTDAVRELVAETEIVSEMELTNYERIISFKMAQYIHNLKVPLVSVDYDLYKKMSIDDKSILDLMYEVRQKNIEDEEVLKLLRKSDAQKYYYLEKDDKEFIDRIVDKFADADISDMFVDLSKKDEDVYAKMNNADKSKTDRLVLFRLQTLIISPDAFIEESTDSLTHVINEIANTSDLIKNADFQAYEKILSMRIAGYIYGKKMPYIESDYRMESRLTMADLSIVDLMYESRTYQHSSELISSMRKSDKMLYKSISQTEKDFIDRIIQKYKDEPDAEFIGLQKDDAQQYNKLNILEKNRIDRLIAAQFPKDIVETNVPDTTSVIVEKRPAIVQNFEFETGQNCLNPKVTADVLTSTTGTKISSLKIDLFSQGKHIAHTYTDTKGFFEFDDVEANKIYDFKIETKKLLDGSVYFINNFKLKCEEAKVETVIAENTNVVEDSRIRPIENVFFGYNDAKISPEAVIVIERIITYYKTHDNCIVYLNAFTDNVGSEDYNLYLSKQRGKAVLNYMTTHGVNWKHIKIHAEGKENPSVPNSNSKQREINRRVEIIVMGVSE